jgi:eukaryotic-like serine/threonine-protein kinase
VLSELGRGSLGVVFEAESLSSGKRVVIKWLSAARAGEQGHERFVRFQREGRTISQICHPHIVDVHDLGERDGTPFVVTERLYGETLRARLSRGPLSWSEAARVIACVLRGLSAAHRAGVVHRELKPENIFLCMAEHDLPPTPKLLDFGMACWRPAPDGAGSALEAGPPPALPDYLALEQLTGGPVDARADIYALGVVMYEALTSTLPFQARGAADLAVLQATALPARPSLHQPALRGARERLVLRALGSAPQARYPDAAAFATALEARHARLGPRLARGLAAAVLLAGAAYALYAEHGVAWSKAARASSTAEPPMASAPALPAAQPPPAPEPVQPVEPPAGPARQPPPKPSKRWLAHQLAVTRGAEATRALQAERAAQSQLTPQQTPVPASGQPAAATQQNPYASPASEPTKDR